MTNKELETFNAWLNAPGTGLESTLYEAFRAVEVRNERQRASRLTDAQKAKEALASRKSYWKKVAAHAEHEGFDRNCRACEAVDRSVTG